MTKTTHPGGITPADVEKAAEVTAKQDEAKSEEATSALDILLGATAERQTEKIIVPKRAGLAADLELTIQSLTDREFKSISDEAEQATPGLNRRQRRAGAAAAGTNLDSALFLRLIVSAGVADPPLDHPEMLQRFGATRGEQVVDKVLLPGEISRVAELIMDLSGFNDNTIEFAKN